MGFRIDKAQMNQFMNDLSDRFDFYAPRRFAGGSIYADADCVRYGRVKSIDEVVFTEKASYSAREVVNPNAQTLLFFTEQEQKVADAPKKGRIIFLRSCDLNAMKRQDEMYLHNGPADYYYKRIRENTYFILMGCSKSFENCFCVSMGSNRADSYDMSIDPADEGFLIDVKNEEWREFFDGAEVLPVEPACVTENELTVMIPEKLSNEVAKASLWKSYNTRCIKCGRCTVVCPTCTCYTMQDIYYTDNGKVGERRRVTASCMIDGYTTVAGGESYRNTPGERMRFKVLHKVLNYKERFGYTMCVGCGRCDDVCPEYISFSNCVNQLGEAMKEVEANE